MSNSRKKTKASRIVPNVRMCDSAPHSRRYARDSLNDASGFHWGDPYAQFVGGTFSQTNGRAKNDSLLLEAQRRAA